MNTRRKFINMTCTDVCIKNMYFREFYLHNSIFQPLCCTSWERGPVCHWGFPPVKTGKGEAKTLLYMYYYKCQI